MTSLTPEQRDEVEEICADYLEAMGLSGRDFDHRQRSIRNFVWLDATVQKSVDKGKAAGKTLQSALGNAGGALIYGAIAFLVAWALPIIIHLAQK